MTLWHRTKVRRKWMIRGGPGAPRMGEWLIALSEGWRIPTLRRFERREAERLGRALKGRSLQAKVACIVPTYRRAASPYPANKSILAQTERDLVVVVVDDGGGLPQLPDDPRVVGVSLSRHTGIAGVVRNVGMRLSRSPYVAFLDDDNSWQANHLEVFLLSLEDGADLVYAGVERTLDGRRLDILSRPFDRRALARRSYVDVNAIVARRGKALMFSRLKRSPRSRSFEDREMVYRLSGRWRVAHVPVVTVNYIVHKGNYFNHWT